MKCYICNKTMEPGEIKFNKDFKKFEPCSRCMTVVREQMEYFAGLDRRNGEKEKPNNG